MLSGIFGMILVAAVTYAAKEDGGPGDTDPFTYDYTRLRIMGLIVAAVLCAMGVIVLLAGKCRCKFNQNKRTRSNSTSATGKRDATDC
uniref:FXYD domain-containing ion transport regulator n=1 Tax=Callorhinchus milii TaxID=7868 RepID=V9LIY0_CALMI